MVFTLSGEADMISTCLDECCNRQDVIEFFWTLTEEELGFGVKSKYAHITLITLSATKFEKITHSDLTFTQWVIFQSLWQFSEYIDFKVTF